jgi:hypothetical protein
MRDFHAHSNESDGSLSPEQLVDHAVEKGVSTCALTDHDTTTGIQRFCSYARDKGIHGIGGVEVSANWSEGNCHIVGLNVRDDYGPLEDALSEIRNGRNLRNERIIQKLNDLGVDITLEEVEELAGGEVVSRPHMARIMHHKGIVSSVKEAFDTYFAKGGPAYVERYRLDPPDAVKLLHEAGGLVILAHPTQLKISVEETDTLIEQLAPLGLAGIEVYTPYANDEEVDRYRDIAQKHDLVQSGGSDFHGESKPDHYLGYYRKEVPIPQVCLDSVIARM